MATLIQSMQVAGFPSVANSGNPATGAGLLGSIAIEYWSDGSIVVITSAGKRVRLEEDLQTNNIWNAILKGTNGLSTSKTLNTAA